MVPKFYQILSILIVIFIPNTLESILKEPGEVMSLTSDEHCDRYSLDALFHDFYWPRTLQILNDLETVIVKSSENVRNELSTMMSKMTESSSRKDQAVLESYVHAETKLKSKIFEIKSELKNSWMQALDANRNFTGGEDGYGRKDVVDALNKLRATYIESFNKTTVAALKGMAPVRNYLVKNRNGFDQIRRKEIMKKDENKTVDERMHDIIKDILPVFTATVTMKILEENILLAPPTLNEVKAEIPGFQDLVHEISLFITKGKAAATSLLSSDTLPSQNLGRRDIYLLWARKCQDIYKQRIKPSKKRNTFKGDEIAERLIVHIRQD